MMPESLTPTSERGFYIVWDPQNWRKERVVSLSHAVAVLFLVFWWRKMLTCFFFFLSAA